MELQRRGFAAPARPAKFSFGEPRILRAARDACARPVMAARLVGTAGL
jgi:hypothetical protein